MAIGQLPQQTELSGNIVLLCRFLRHHGFRLGPTEASDALTALSLIPISNPRMIQQGLRVVLSRNKDQYERFVDLYNEFWERMKRDNQSKRKLNDMHESSRKKIGQEPEPSLQMLKKWLYSEGETQEEVAGYSRMEVLSKKDFNKMDEDELRLIMRLIQKMVRLLTHQQSRLRKATKLMHTLDVKRTVRLGMRRTGDIQRFIFSEPKNKRLKILLLCDVSKSMELYSRFFIYLIYAFQQSYDKITTHVFSTAMHDVSKLLANYDFGQAFELIAERIPHWSGGTRIGQCFHQFLMTNPRSMDKKTLVMILSDGWDTGEPALLKESMSIIHKSCRKVIWLNPLAGHPNYRPEVTGIQTALPYIDHMVAAHNLESLRQVLVGLRGSFRSYKAKAKIKGISSA